MPYELDNGQVLTATAGELSTTYLYGLAPIAELTGTWSYSLPDGAVTLQTSEVSETSEV